MTWGRGLGNIVPAPGPPSTTWGEGSGKYCTCLGPTMTWGRDLGNIVPTHHLGEGSGKYRTCPGPTIYHLGGGVWEISYLPQAHHLPLGGRGLGNIVPALGPPSTTWGEGSGKYRTCPGPTIYHFGYNLYLTWWLGWRGAWEGRMSLVFNSGELKWRRPRSEAWREVWVALQARPNHFRCGPLLVSAYCNLHWGWFG